MLAHNREALFEGGQSLFGVLRVVSIQAEFGDTPRLLSDALLSYMNMLAREFQRGFGGNHKVIVALRPINSGGNRTRFALRCRDEKETASAKERICRGVLRLIALPHTRLTTPATNAFVAAAVKELARVVCMTRQNCLYIRALGCLTVNKAKTKARHRWHRRRLRIAITAEFPQAARSRR